MMFLKSVAKAAVYQAVDVCTLGRGVRREICGESVWFPARWSRWYSSQYEPQTFEFLRKYCIPRSVVMDIGAHFGLFSVIMSRLVGPEGRVISFEPTTLSRSVASKTVRLSNCHGNVEIRGEAVSNRRGVATFYETGDPASNANSLVQCSGRGAHVATVPTIRLDDLVAENGYQVSCLKIDVEGAELDCLLGARELFLSQRPAAALSLHPRFITDSGGSLSDIWDLLVEYQMSVGLLDDYRVGTGQTVMDRSSFVRQREVFDVKLLPLPAKTITCN